MISLTYAQAASIAVLLLLAGGSMAYYAGPFLAWTDRRRERRQYPRLVLRVDAQPFNEAMGRAQRAAEDLHDRLHPPSRWKRIRRWWHRLFRTQATAHTRQGAVADRVIYDEARLFRTEHRYAQGGNIPSPRRVGDPMPPDLPDRTIGRLHDETHPTEET